MSIIFRPKKFRALWDGKLVIILNLVKSTKLLFHSVQAYFSGSFLTQNGMRTAGRIHARVCIVPNAYENRECSGSTSSRSGKEGKIIGILIQSIEKIIVSKTSGPDLGPTILYKLAQRPGREAIHSFLPSPTVSSWTGAQKARAHLYLSYTGYKKPIPFSIFHTVTARESVLSCWQWSSLTFQNLTVSLTTEKETKKCFMY